MLHCGGRASLTGHCGHGWTCSLPRPAAVDTRQPQVGAPNNSVYPSGGAFGGASTFPRTPGALRIVAYFYFGRNDASSRAWASDGGLYDGSSDPIALVVEDAVLERELMVAVLEEESTMGVIQCQSAEEALRVLEKMGGRVADIYRRQSGRQD
jgi:hypothetical protein